MKPRCSVCMYNFYVGYPLIGLGKFAKGTLTYATQFLEEVPQYLEEVVWRTVQVAQLFQIYKPWTDPNKIVIVVLGVYYGFPV